MIEIDSRTAHLEIRVKNYVPLLSRPIIKAFVWSALIHLFLVCAFRIKMIDYHEVKYPVKPIDVAIVEERDTPITTVIDQSSSLLQPYVSINDPRWESSRGKHLEKSLPLTALMPRPKPSSLGPTVSDTIIASNQKSLSTAPPLYPLRLKFSPAVKRLKLLVDGSSLFKRGEDPLELHQLLLSPSRLPIRYDVTINGKSGKITRWKRDETLSDTAIQTCADTLIALLRFAPSQHEKIQGSICLTFRCTGQELKQFLIKPEGNE